MRAHDLDCLFYPDSVAVVGASNHPSKASYHVIHNMLKDGYKGRIYPINPKESEVQGLKCYPALKDIHEKVDLLVIGIGAKFVREVFYQARERDDIKGAIIISAGFAETAIPERVAWQKEIAEICREKGIRLFGPNCNGIMNAENGINTSFAPGVKMRLGNAAYFSQSGALGGTLVVFAGEQPVPMGFNKWAHMGNMSDVTNIEVLRYFGSDDAIDAIAGYMESVRDGRELMETAAQITCKKPVLVLKVGRTELGSRAAQSHTGSLAGSDAIYESAFKQCGIVRVQDVEELTNAMKAISFCKKMKGNRVAVLTEAGGPGIICMDALVAGGVAELAPMYEATRDRLVECLPEMAMVCKPNGYVDMSAAAMEKEHEEALRAVLEDDQTDGVIMISLPPTFLPALEVVKGLVPVIKAYQKPVFLCLFKGEAMAEARAYLEENGIPTFDTPNQAAQAMGDLIRASRNLGEVRFTRGSEAENPHPLVKQAHEEGRNLLEPEAMNLLRDYGIPVGKFGWAKSRAEAGKLADEIGYPLVMKIVSPQIIHKSDYGAVKLNLQNRTQVEEEYDKLIAHVLSLKPDAEMKGVILAPMVNGGVEVIAGMVKDPQFGPSIMFGSGGILVELLKDVSFRIAPLREQDAEDMIRETKAYKMLCGMRGDSPKDIGAMVNLLVSLGRLAAENPMIQEIDLNPVKAQEQGINILDARIIIG
ncbi:acetate--CoA ligase family protein [Anaerotruncus rubiinfantis]|uniref:acetate--CoA ligase family protein n=1 Tax=Anaerotruncus rubiinfantis TaxID=1720200 RepID=UPI0034A305E6